MLFIVAVAACEAGIALALFLMLYRRGKSLDAVRLAGAARSSACRQPWTPSRWN